MTEEETDALYNEILKLPKVERPITATTQCEINVNDLFDTIRAFRKIPDYNELIKDNHKKQQEIERLNNRVKQLEKSIMISNKKHSFMTKDNIKLRTIINELEKWLDKKEKLTFNSWNKGIHEVQRKLQELKEGEKSEKN